MVRVDKKKDKHEYERRGFTLIELLAVIIIIAVVGGLGFTYFNNINKKAKEKSRVLAINNLKSAAELFVKEEGNRRNWSKNFKNNLQVGYYTCITVTDLVNAGYLKKNFYKDDIYDGGISGNTFLEMYQGNNYDDIDIKINNTAKTRVQCLSALINEKVLNYIQLDNNKSYTDTLEFKVSPKVSANVENYTYSYDIGLGRVVNTCSGNQCVISNLKNYTDYPLTLCMNIEGGEQICDEFTLKTADFVSPLINLANKSIWMKSKDITLKFDSTNIKNNQKMYYFKSSVDANIKFGSLFKCSTPDNCSPVSKVVADSDNWYRSATENIILTVGGDNVVVRDGKFIVAKIMDNTRNFLNKDEEVMRIDGKPPVCTTSTSTSEWTNKNVMVKGTCSDSDSGCKKSYVSVTKTSAINADVTPGSVADRAGNVTVCDAKRVKIDKTAPECVSSGGNDSWTKESVAIKGDCTDEENGSGCKQDSITLNVTTTTNGDTSPGIVYDNAGNSSDCPPRKVMVDKDGPLCTTTGGSSSWTKNDVTVTGTCNDNGGSGCKETTVSVTKNTTTSEYVSPGTVYDEVGNSTVCDTAPVFIDKAVPSVSLKGYDYNYQFEGIGTDSHSGVSKYKWDSGAWKNYDGSYLTRYISDGSKHTLYVQDAVGNESSASLTAYKLCNRVFKEFDSWPSTSDYYDEMYAKTFKWSSPSESNCSGNSPYREYTFKEYGCNCRFDDVTGDICSGATSHDYTSYTHSSGKAQIYYHNSDNGRKACKNAKVSSDSTARVSVNSYVKKICSSSTIAAGSTLDYHGYRFYYYAASAPYASFAATSYYTHTGGSYTDRVASSSTSDAACQKSCEHTY